MIQLQEQGDLTWESEVRIDVNGKEYDLADFMGHQMPTMDVDDWYYLLKAEIPSEDNVELIDIHYQRMKHAPAWITRRLRMVCTTPIETAPPITPSMISGSSWCVAATLTASTRMVLTSAIA
jgi:hypothetical protein